MSKGITFSFVTGMVGDIHLTGSMGVGSWTAQLWSQFGHNKLRRKTMLPPVCGNKCISYWEGSSMKTRLFDLQTCPIA